MIAWYHQPTIFSKRFVLPIAGILAICVVLITTVFFSVATHAASGVNQTLSFEGRLLTANGSVVPDGYYNIQFKIYENGDGQEAGDTGGTLDWTETYLNNGGTAGVKVTNGFFSVNLGSQTPFGNEVNWNNDTLWLSMNVAGSASDCTTFNSGDCTADGEMTPMNRITSSPYAMNSGELDGLSSNDFLQVAQGVQTDASDGTSLALNKTGSGDFLDLQNAGTSVFNIDDSGDINLGGDSDKTISVGTAADSTSGSSLTVSGGSAGSGTGGNGGDLVLQGGDATGDGTTTTDTSSVFPHTPVLDNFNRANGSLGSNWSALGSTSEPTISSDTMQASGYSVGIWNTPLTSDNGEVYATVTNTGGTNYPEFDLLIYSLTTNNYYLMSVSQGSNPSWQISKGSTVLNSFAGPDVSAGDKIGLEHDADGTITLMYQPSGGSWTAVGSVTDTSYDITGYNIGIVDNGSNYDDFGGGSFTPSSGTTTSPANGGNVIIKSGTGSGSGASGNITLQGGSSSTVVIDDSGVTLGHASGGNTTTLNLDSGSSAPTSDVLGSMYYDTTLGEVQCYEANGWGDCSNSPNQFVSLSPTYANAVVHTTGTGTLTTDMCSDALNINDGSNGQPTVCGTNETYNYYDWTATSTTAQTRSIYVTYQLPSNFKGFASGGTSLKARTDSTNSTVSYKIYRNDSSGLTECGSAITASTGSQTLWQMGTASGTADPANCSFVAGDSIVFEIDLSANSSANAYTSNLNFTLK